MSSLKTGTPAGSIIFAFENLCILLESGECRVFGDVTIAFDGAGAYWPVAMRLHGSEPKSPIMHVRYGIGLWREIMRRVEQYHAADVARLINEQLEARGVHMALFDEHAATMGRRPVPPHVRPAARAAPLLARSIAGSTANDRTDAARLAVIETEIAKMFNPEELPPDGEIGDFDDPIFETMREVQGADMASLEQERDAIQARIAQRAALKSRRQKNGSDHKRAFVAEVAALVVTTGGFLSTALVAQAPHTRQGVRISTLYAGQGR